MQSELDELSVAVAVVTFEADFLAQAYIADTDLQWPLLVDADRELYHAYDMLEASFWDVWGPKTIAAYATEMWRGNKLQKSDGDVSQRGGDVLIDPDGTVQMHHVGDGPADRPAPEAILDIVRRYSRAENAA